MAPIRKMTGRDGSRQHKTQPLKTRPRNFVSSANQSSTDQTYPYYINWEFSPYERGKRINDRLTAMTQSNGGQHRSICKLTATVFMHQNYPPCNTGYGR